MCAPSSSPGCAGDPIPNPIPIPIPFLPFPPSLGGRPARTGLSRAVIFLPTSSPVCLQDCKAGARSCWLITRAKPLSCPKYPRDLSSSGPERLRFSDLGKGRAQKVPGQPQGELKQLETRRRRRSGESKPTCAPSSSLCLCWSRWPGIGGTKSKRISVCFRSSSQPNKAVFPPAAPQLWPWTSFLTQKIRCRRSGALLLSPARAGVSLELGGSRGNPKKANADGSSSAGPSAL